MSLENFDALKIQQEIMDRGKALIEEVRMEQKALKSYPGGSIQYILDNVEMAPHWRNYFLKLKRKDEAYKAKHVELNNEEKKIQRDLDSLITDSFGFVSKNKNFFVSQIEKSYELEKSQRFILNGALSMFGKKTVISFLPKFIKEQKDLADFLYENHDEILKMVEAKDKDGLWNLIGETICDAILPKKGESFVEHVEKKAKENEVINTKEVEDYKKVLDEKYAKKLADLESNQKSLDEQRNKLEERLQALSVVEEKYSNLLKELEEKALNTIEEAKEENPDKVSGVATMDYVPESKVEEPVEQVVEEEVQKAEPKVELIDGFTATESAVINHMREVLRHKKGTQNIWIDDETDKEHTFLSTEKLSRSGRVITDAKEILDYYKESRNVEKI